MTTDRKREPSLVYAFEGASVALMARVSDIDAALITQASVASIAYSVIDKPVSGTPTVIVDAAALTVANVVFDTLQTPAAWTKDTTGYNFRYDAPPSEMPDGNSTYRFEFVFTMADATITVAAFEVKTTDLLNS